LKQTIEMGMPYVANYHCKIAQYLRDSVSRQIKKNLRFLVHENWPVSQKCNS
jgi:hypothetical protein